MPQNPLLSSTCINSISDFPYVQNFEFGLNNWVHDPNNDFDWSFNYNSTPSVNTGPSIAFEGIQYLYTEASNNNHPSKTASIISPCLNLSQYNNPILVFIYINMELVKDAFQLTYLSIMVFHGF